MIREPLEQNGVKIEYIRDWHSSIIKINDNGKIFKTRYNGNYIKEYGARQYVKENGFKIKWFDDRTKKILFGELNPTKIICFQLLDILNEYDSREDKEEQINKLIAWLYANDIEITND